MEKDSYNSAPLEILTQDTLTKHADKLISKFNDEQQEITGEFLMMLNIREIPVLIDPFLQQVGLACLAGSSDTGKSCLLRQLAISIVTGAKDFLGFSISAKHRSVIYVSTEDDQGATSYLLKKQAENYEPVELKELRFIFDTHNLLAELDRRLAGKLADVVIIDCFSDVFGKNLKETQEIRAFLHPYQELAIKYHCLILFLHHTGKRTEDLEPNKNNLLSGQGFEAKMRVVMELRADQTTSNLRHLCVVKGNYLSAKHKRESFVLKFDESKFSFSNTGDSTPFELLSKKNEEDKSKTKWKQAKELKEKGLIYEEIAPLIGFRSKGSVSKLFDRAIENGWETAVSDGNAGNDEETETEMPFPVSEH